MSGAQPQAAYQPYIRNWQFRDKSENVSLTKIFNLVERGSRVLDIGCGAADLGAELRELKKCHVTGVDQNPTLLAIAERKLDEVIASDVQNLSFISRLREHSFDAVIFADVLEHIQNPGAILYSVQKLLRPGGAVIISIPNIAHSSIRLALLQGRFDYTPEGLLDRTHIHLYTRKSLAELVHEAGYSVVEEDSTHLGVWDTEIEVKPDMLVTDELIQAVENAPDGTVYQFVVKLVCEPDAKNRLSMPPSPQSAPEIPFNAERAATQRRWSQPVDERHALAETLERLERLEALRTQSDAAIRNFRLRFQTVEDSLRKISSSADQSTAELRNLNFQVSNVSHRFARYTDIPPLSWLRALRRKLRGDVVVPRS